MTNDYKYTQAEDAIALCVFAHGAGANMDSEFIVQISDLLVKHQISVLRFNFYYMQRRASEGRKFPPDRMPKLIDAFEQVMALDEVKNSQLPVFIGGKSMGSRVATTMLNDSKALGAFCFGYPFHPQKKPEKLRLEPLQDALKPVLILQGERDALGSKDDISAYELAKHCQVAFFDDGDHDLKPRVKSGFTHSQHKQKAVASLVDFIQQLANENKLLTEGKSDE